MSPVVASIVSGFVGLMFGSLSNAVAWRLKEQENIIGTKKKNRYTKEQLSISRGRSMCVHCGHQLSAADLIPVVSWILLKGKCRYCKKTISRQYPLVEVIVAIIFALTAYYWPFGYQNNWSVVALVGYLCIIVLYAILCIYDIRWMILPDKLTYLAAVLALLVSVVIAFLVDDMSLLTWLKGIIFAIMMTSGVFWLLFIFSKGQWIGGGDIKIGISIGFLLASFERGFMMLFLASLMGSVVSLPLLIKYGKSAKKTTLAFGPFLMFASWLVLIYGDRITSWYETTLLL